MKYAAVVANFPASIAPDNSITAGDKDFFSELFQKTISLSNGSEAKVNKVLVDGVAVENTYIINIPKSYTLTVSVSSGGKDYTKDYPLVVKALEVKINNLNDYAKVQQPLSIENQKTLYGKLTMEMIGMGNMMKFLQSTILTPNSTTKPVIILEQMEGKHEFLSQTGILTDNMPGIETRQYDA